MLAREAHSHPAGNLETLVPLLVVAVVATGYLMRAVVRAREPRGWSRWRTASFLAGCALLAVGLGPGLLPFAPGDLRGHMLQHR